MSTPTPQRKSSLLRASVFCQAREPPKHHVTISLLDRVPKRKRRDEDVQSAVFASQDLMVSLSLQQGDVAWLKPTVESCSESLFDGVPVMVYLQPKKLAVKNNDSEIIQVPPTIAASIGCYRNGGSAWLKPLRRNENIRDAHTVTVRSVGHPVPRVTLLLPSQHSEEQDPFRVLQRRNSQQQRLLSASSLISVMDQQRDLHFFEMVDIQQNNNATEKETSCNSFVFRTSLSTRWRLLESATDTSTGLVRRLPSLSLARFFHQSIDRKSRNDTDNMEPEEVNNGGHHPSLEEMVQALSIPPVRHAPAPKIVHVVGTDANHVEVCVKAAANRLGRRYLPIHGLAAYAHGAGETVSTGSLVDQMAGWHAAVTRAQHCAPCVIHLHDFQHELSQTDEPLRHTQEQRFWTAFMEALTLTTTTNSNADDDRCLTHPVLVVISTQHHLSAGPLLQNLIHPSVKLHPPNEAYARSLWGTTDNFDDICPYILGRTAEEIVQLRRLLNIQCNKKESCDDSRSDAISVIQSLCEQLDARKKKTISVSIPNVHWEDVGGLTHVRQEIMDAIELPLRYPHLFPQSGGRSGILLYGPPGTGKTLVAKAVATECGLPFLSVKGPELLGSYVGESEANVRATFAAARQAAAAATSHVGGILKSSQGRGAAILFFDELDSLAPRRGGVGDGGGVMERVVATLLTELDGRQTAEASTSSSDDDHPIIVFVIGATNRPDLLDPSLLRPGRLDRLVYLGQATTTEDRAKILAALMRKFKVNDDTDVMTMARQVVDQLPPNLSGADFSSIASGALMRSLQRLCNEADAEAAFLQGERSRNTASDKEQTVDIEEVLRSWEDDRLEPVVTVDDLTEAGKDVVPSVSAQELANFEQLRVQFSSS